MFNFDANENFEPSSNTKHWILYTHKTKTTSAGILLPGLFQTTYFEWQLLGFFGIFVLEGIATYWAYIDGVIVTAILASIFVDFVLAVAAHAYQKDICLLRNEIVYTDDKTAGGLRRRLRQSLTKQQSLYSLIYISAFLKIYWFITVHGIFDATAMLIMTSYLIGALLHVKATGYALYTLVFKYLVNKEHVKYGETNGEAFAFDMGKPIPEPLGVSGLTLIEVGHHRISLDVNISQGSKKDRDAKNILLTRGLLTDSELHQLISHQVTPELRRAVAIVGLKHQVSMLDQDPASGDMEALES